MYAYTHTHTWTLSEMMKTLDVDRPSRVRYVGFRLG